MSSDQTTSGSELTVDRSRRSQAAILVVAWVVLLGLVVGLGELLTGPLDGSVGATDRDLARWFAGHRTSTRTDIAQFLTLLGETVTVIVLGLLIAFGVWWWQRSLRPALFVVITSAGVSAMYVLAAVIVSRPRPPVKILDPGLVPDHSFPSGHVAAATGLYGLMVVLVWTYARAARWWVLPLLVLPLLVGVARLYEGAHFLSDALTSLLLASAWLAVTTTTLLPPPQLRT